VVASSSFDASDNGRHFGYYWRALSGRRSSSIHSRRYTAGELPVPPKSIELETRIARLELVLTDLRRTMEVLTKRTAALQAELDHLSAKLGAR
jgi:hypothetical protein